VVSDRQEALTRTLDLLAELIAADRRDAIDRALETARVRLVVDAADLADARTQAAVYVLVSLLVRSGLSPEADLPPARRHVDLPGLHDDDFSSALAAAVPRMFPGARLIAPIDAPDVAVVVGSAPAPPCRELVRLSADGPCARITRGERAVGCWAPSDSLAAMASAGLAAGESLKDVLRPIATEHIEVLDPLEPVFEVPFSVEDPVDLGRLIVVSAGAITQQFLLTLAAVARISGDLVLLDRDTTALSNANRCSYVMVDELNRPKVEVIAAQLPARLSVTPIQEHLEDHSLKVVPADAAIVVGADDIGARHLAQTLDPAWLVIGATSHFMVLITEHPAGEPCAGCAHRDLGDDVAVVPTWSIVSFWAGYLVGLRVIARYSGISYPPTRRVTNFYPLRPEAISEHGLAFNRQCPVRVHRETRRAG
jgi:hypothetical protein